MELAGKLRDARMARGWSVEEVGSQLRLPARVVARVEEGDLDGLGAPIYQRGYLRSFARLVGVPESEVEHALQASGQQVPSLVATGVRPRSEYMFDRYVRPATYIALTALIALPVVWWAASGKLGEGLAGNRFDLQPPAGSNDAGRMVALPTRPEPAPLAQEQPEVLRASMIAVPPVTQVGPPVPPEATAAIESTGDILEVVGAGRHEAVLVLQDKSWVEVTDGSGRRVHQALRTPGRWSYRSDERLQFTIGNSRLASLSTDGTEVDLSGHRSSNDVVRIEVFADPN